MHHLLWGHPFSVDLQILTFSTTFHWICMKFQIPIIPIFLIMICAWRLVSFFKAVAGPIIRSPNQDHLGLPFVDIYIYILYRERWFTELYFYFKVWIRSFKDGPNVFSSKKNKKIKTIPLLVTTSACLRVTGSIICGQILPHS